MMMMMRNSKKLPKLEKKESERWWALAFRQCFGQLVIDLKTLNYAKYRSCFDIDGTKYRNMCAHVVVHLKIYSARRVNPAYPV